MKASLIRILGFLTSLAPLGIYVGINLDEYAPTITESVKLGISGVIVLVLAFLLALKKMKLPKGLFAVVLVLGLLIGLQAILVDLVAIWTWFTVGYATDTVVVERWAKNVEATEKENKQLRLTAEAIKEAIRSE